MVRRGNQLLQAGDIVAARRFFERAAADGDAAVLLGVGQTFDPLFLAESGMRGPTGDAAAAAQWYGKAAGAGSKDAAARLRLLARVFPQLAAAAAK